MVAIVAIAVAVDATVGVSKLVFSC
jgi:hypothetical protein